MARRHYLLAVVALLLIPVASIVGTHIAFAINPEFAAGRPDYVRDFRLLTLAKEFVLLATGLVDCGLWLLCGAFLLQAKARSYWWLPLAILGPFGFGVLAVLDSRAPNSGDLYQRFVGRMGPLVRVAFEITFFVAVWIAAYEAMVLWRNLKIVLESIVTGVPVAVIIDQQNASSGMFAFGEGLEVLFLVALLYLLRPVCFIVAGSLGKSLLSSWQADKAPVRRDSP